ncbi:MAG: S8 family serine peptidase [Candidatus Lokiarchaeota archaeon]|nr:S8 family serine peptidase [Candidatus Lokiarchaeota archaeon]
MSRNIHKRLRLAIISISGLLLFLSPIFIINGDGEIPHSRINFSISPYQQLAKNIIYDSIDEKVSLEESSANILMPYSTIYGEFLLKKIHAGTIKENQKENILVVFTDDISHNGQKKALDRVGFTYSLKKQYKNVAVALIETTIGELLHYEETIKDSLEFHKFFLDTIQPVHLQETPSGADLLDEENWWLDAIGVTNVPFNGSGIRIAILDTGIYSDHADFSSKSVPITHANFATFEGSRDPFDTGDTEGHGTHVAGIAGGTGASSSGKYKGVAPGALILNVKTLNNYGGIRDSDLLDAIDWIITQKNADIISMSFRTIRQQDVYNPFSLIFDAAARNGIVSVAAAGNDGPQFLTAVHPATIPSVISVGAINRDLDLTSFSSLGPSYMNHIVPDILAPGQDIIAPEAHDSLLGYRIRYTNSQIDGAQPNSDYITLSGTSMATPMVSGAIALILEAYPNLTPEGVRAALYHGAYLPEAHLDKYGANGIGAGIINVSASIDWLNSLGDPYNFVQAFPDRLPYEPFDMISYPGDTQRFNISIYSAKNSSLSLTITSSVSTDIRITPITTFVTFANHSVQHVQFEMKILENATSGMEFGSIWLNDSGTGILLEQIDYQVDIMYPIGKVYFDSLHGLNDIYPEWPSGYSQIEIYKAMKDLHANGYQLEYLMENWTINRQDQLTSRLLTPDLLSTFDIIVLQTPVIPYTDSEIDALHTYFDKGGSILILGTRYQTIAVNSINILLTQLNTDININSENIFDYTDVGFGYILKKYNISEIDTSSSIFSIGDHFTYWFGATLGTGEDAQSIATHQNKTIVASHESETGGKVVVWSDFHWLRNDVYENGNSLYHNRILLNLFEYMNTQEQNDYIIATKFNATIQTEGTLEMYLSLTDSIMHLPINNRVYGDSLNATIISPINTKTPLILDSYGNGVYSNLSFSLGLTDYRHYTIQLNISSPSGVISKEYPLYRINDSYLVEIGDPIISNREINRSPGSSNTIQYTGNQPNLTTDLSASLITESIYSLKSGKEYLVNLTPSGISYDYVFSVTGEEQSGLFVFFAIATSLDNYTNFEVTRSVFRISNLAPEFQEDDSYFNNFAFSDTQTEESYYIIPVNDIGKIDITVSAEESVGFEDSRSELYAIVYYTAAVSGDSFFDRILPQSIPTEILAFQSATQDFQGEFKLPKTLSFSGSSGSLEVSQESSDDLRYFSILWITVRDTDGGSVDYLILMNVDIVFDWSSFLEYLPLIIVVLGIIGIALAFAFVSKTRRQKSKSLMDSSGSSDTSMDYSNEDYSYCMNCGRKIPRSYQVCPYCGHPQHG